MQPRGISQTDLIGVLEETRPLWEEMRHQRLFLTGGTGFFGCWLLETFLSINEALRLEATVTVLTRSPEAFLCRVPHLAHHPVVTLLAGDIESFRFPPGGFAYVIHAATDVACIVDAKGGPAKRVASMVQGTVRVLEFAATHGTRKFLFTSSGSVYGQQPERLNRIPESFCAEPVSLSPASAYAVGKRASELVCAEYSKTTSLEIKIARCFTFAGPYLALDANFALGNFIRNVIHGRDILIQGDGTPTRSYLYAGDLAIWLWTILFHAPSMHPLNVGSEVEVSIVELAHSVVTTLNPALAVEISKVPIPNAPRIRYVPSTGKVRELLGLRETVSLDESIRRMAAWNGFPLP